MDRGTTSSKPVLLSDVGGVVVEDHWRCVAELLSERYPLDPVRARALLYRLCPPLDVGAESLEEFHRGFVQSSGVSVPLAEFQEITLDRGLRLIGTTFRLYLRLRQEKGVRIIAVSNIAEILWTSIEKKFQVSRLFDRAVISSRLGVTKPDRRFFEAAVAAAGVPAEECVFVDDSATNVRGAEAVGIHAFQISGGPRQLEDVLTHVYGAIGRRGSRRGRSPSHRSGS